MTGARSPGGHPRPGGDHIDARRHRPFLAAVVLTVALTGVISAPAPANAASARANLAERLRSLPSGTRQVIIVHTTRYRTSTARLEAYVKVGGHWRAALPRMTAWIGAAGFSDRKREGDRATPTGVYSIGGTMYGLAARPRVRYAYHRLRPGDWWNENSASRGYNTFVHGRDPGGPSEPLWRIRPHYTYFAVITYNTRRVPGRGSGIFLHQIGSRHRTAGCVALRRSDLLRVLTWLDPAARPRIVLGPDRSLRRY